MKTRENIHQKLHDLFQTKLGNKLTAPLIQKVSCFNKGDFNNRFDLRVATDENQLGNWWRHPIYIIAKPSAEKVVINITIQPQRWPEELENYANEFKHIIDQKYQEINDLIKSHSINASDVKQDIKTETKFVLSYSFSVTIDKANPTDEDYIKFIDFLASLCQITVSLSDELPVGDDTSKLEENDSISNEITTQDIIKSISNENKRVYLFCLSVSTDEDIQIVSEQIFDKIQLIKNYIEDQIDKNVKAFLFEEFNQSYQLTNSLNNKSIEDSDFMKYILQLVQKYTQTDFNGYFEFEYNVSFIFDINSKIDEVGIIDVWNEKFLELSAEVDENITVYGYHEVYEDIIRQIYDHGEWETGLIATEQGYFEASISDYIRSEAGWEYPKESIFDLTTYMKKSVITIEENMVSKKEFSHNEIAIGQQVWSSKNLNVDKFRNGDPIPELKNNDEWQLAGRSGNPGWCYYNYDPENGEKYGKLYNWYAISDSRGLTEVGWHVASNDDWTTLIENLGGESDAGLKMQSKNDWSSGTNESGFLGLPGGFFDGEEFTEIGETSTWWSSTYLNDDIMANNFTLDSSGYIANGRSNKKYFGYSVRCLKD